MMELSDMRIGCAMTGSFCTFKSVFEAWRSLKATGAALTPIMSFNAASVDTRFYPAKAAVAEFMAITGKSPLRRWMPWNPSARRSCWTRW